jgi:hypothetical protein
MDISEQFNQNNGLMLVARAHQLTMEVRTPGACRHARMAAPQAPAHPAAA